MRKTSSTASRALTASNGPALLPETDIAAVIRSHGRRVEAAFPESRELRRGYTNSRVACATSLPDTASVT